MSTPEAPDRTESRRIAEATRRALIEAALQAYDEAGLSGLCAEGRWEVAIGVIRNLDVGPFIDPPDPETKQPHPTR